MPVTGHHGVAHHRPRASPSCPDLATAPSSRASARMRWVSAEASSASTTTSTGSAGAVSKKSRASPADDGRRDGVRVDAGADHVRDVGSDVAADDLRVETQHRVGSAVAGEAEPRQRSQGEDVARLGRREPLTHLGGDEAGRAEDRGVGRATGQAGGAEVEQQGLARGGEHDVGG